MKAVKFFAEILNDYVGQYILAPAFELTVTTRDGALFVQATDQSKFRVFASAKDQFFYKTLDARISFERDPAGAVTGLILHQNGHDTPGKTAEQGRSFSFNGIS